MEYNEFIKSIPPFQNLTQDNLEVINNSIRYHNFRKGQIIDFCNSSDIYIFYDGCAKLVNWNKFGKERIFYIYGQNEVACPFFFDKQHNFNLEFAQNTEILLIPEKVITSMLESKSSFSIDTITYLTKQFQRFLYNEYNIKHLNAYEKVMWFLLKNKDNKELPYPKSLIAKYLNITPESLSRALQKLQKEKVIQVDNRSINILDRDKLCAHCDSEVASNCSEYSSIDKTCAHNSGL